MTSNSHKNPSSRLRSILSSNETNQSVEPKPSPVSRLPKAQSPTPVRSSLLPQATPRIDKPQSSFSRFGPAFWTVTGILSLMVNGILIALILYLIFSLGRLQLTAGGTGANLLSGLYTNFERMDRATIASTIPVDAQIPLNITIPIQKTTTITLASDAVIQNARVRITSAALNIDAPAQVTLPAGTSLEIALALDVPVQTSVPIHLEVPVNIPLSQTQLHEPFTGLQQVIKPLYCMVEPNALNLDGEPICR